MPANTPKGYPYVLPSDHPKEYPAVSQQLAEAIDAAAAALGTWAAWTPTPTGLTLGGHACRWTQIGRTVHFHARLAVSAVTGNASISMPRPAAALSGGAFQFPAILTPASGAPILGGAHIDGGGSTLILRRFDPATLGRYHLTATAPFTWATGSSIDVTGTYETSAAVLLNDEPTTLEEPIDVVALT